MEPVTYAVHRWVMHGPGRTLHRSHHRPPAGRLEANDLFPVAFASLVGRRHSPSASTSTAGTWLVPSGRGDAATALAYGLVHDGFIHGRLAVLAPPPSPGLRSLADAHRLHHLFGGEPYGMLFPVVPARLRSRARSRRSSAARPA